MFKKASDPETIAKDFAKENEIELDENLTQEGSDTSADDKPADSDDKDDKPSLNEDGTPKDSEQDEDKDDQLTEEEIKLVDTDDSELDDDSKAKKAEVKKKRNTGAERRIAELASQVKALTEGQTKRDAEYEQKLAEIEANARTREEKNNRPSSDSLEATLKQQETERISTYMQEDVGLPREQRREMSKEDIDEWLVDDYGEANDWLNGRYDRRKHDKIKATKDVELSNKASEIIGKQEISRIRLEARHPDIKIVTLKARQAELIAEGKTDKEAYTIMGEENPKVKVFFQLAGDKKYMESISIHPDAPERFEKEMLGRLNSKDDGGSDDLLARIAELEDLVKAKELRGEPVGAGVGSRARGGNQVRNVENHNPELAKELKKMKKRGYSMTESDHADAVERRKTIPGSGVYEHETNK